MTMIRRALPLFLILLLGLLLAGCGKPVPAEYSNLVGEWNGPNMYLKIEASGAVNYRRTKPDGSRVTINGPIQEYRRDAFVVGIGPMTTEFKINRQPTQLTNGWEMVVDGVRLFRPTSDREPIKRNPSARQI